MAKSRRCRFRFLSFNRHPRQSILLLLLILLFTFTFNSIFTFIFLPFLQTNPHSLHPNHYLLLGLKEIVIQVRGNWKRLSGFILESMSSQQKLTEADVLSETGKLAR